jgi:hypothetical protein
MRRSGKGWMFEDTVLFHFSELLRDFQIKDKVTALLLYKKTLPSLPT